MKKILCVIVVLLALFSTGCGEKSFSYSVVEQDAYHTGGNLSFSYDESTHTAYFGGEGQFIEYYESDIAKGWKEEGNRIGFKLFMPQGVDDYMSASANLNGEVLEYDDFIVGEENKYALFQPLVDEDNLVMTLKIKWEEGSQEQEYRIIINKNTSFLNKNQNF